ncbi:AsmA-like C-terminal domain-containing protein [Alphaproteobacteria bacterium]|nr:AsmA-like C-terminal domain-containing protein [Alphaproteobacteria bacterium]
MTQTSNSHTASFFGRVVVASLVSLSILLAILLASIAGFIYYATQTSHVTDWLETQLSDPEKGFSVEVGSLSFRIHDAMSPFEISGNDLHISSNNHQLDIPEVRLAFGLNMLVSGMPDKVSVEARSLTLVRADDGWKFSQDQAWLNAHLKERVSAFMVFPALLATLMPDRLMPDRQMAERQASEEQASKRQAISPLPYWPEGLRHLSVRAKSANIFLQGDTVMPTALFNNIEVSAAISGKKGSEDGLSMTLQFDQPKSVAQTQTENTGQIAINATSHLLSGLTTFSARLTDVTLEPLIALVINSGALPSGILAEGPEQLVVDGRISATLDGTIDNEKIHLLSGAIGSSRGDVTLPFGQIRDVRYSDFDADFAYSRDDNLFTVKQTSILLNEQHRLSLSGQLLGVHAALPRMNMTVLAEEVLVSELMTFWPDEWASDKKAQLQQTISGGRFRTATLALKGQFDTSKSALLLSSAQLQGDFSSVRLDAQLPQYQRIVGTLQGAVDIELQQSGQVARAMIDTKMQNGFLSLDQFDKPVRIPEAAVRLRYEPGQLQISHASIDFAENGILGATVNAHLGELLSVRDMTAEMSITANDIPVNFFHVLWPRSWAPKAFPWIRSHIADGIISNASVDMTLDGSEDPSSVVTQVNGMVDLENSSFQLYETMRPVQQIDATLTFADNVLSVNTDNGEMPSLNLTKANVRYGPLYNPEKLPRDIDISLSMSGALTPVMEILDHPRINKLKGTGLTAQSSTGTIEATYSAKGRLPTGGRLALSDVTVDATISDAVIDDLPLAQTLEQGALVLSFDKEALIISGLGVFSDIYSDFSYERKANGAFELNAKIPASNDFATKISDLSGMSLEGSIGGRFSLTGQAGKSDYSLSARTDITQAGINIDALNWAKLPGETGQASGILTFKDGKLLGIEAIDVTAGSLSGKGRIGFQPDGQLSLGYFEDVTMPGNELTTVLLEKTGKTAMKLTAEGSLLNLVPLRRNEGASKGLALDFDITASRIVVGPRITLTGNLKGSTQTDGDGQATLLGSLLFGQQPILSEGTIKARFGPSGEFLEGVGLIGGGEAELSFQPVAPRLSELVITSQNGGRVLKGLNITDSITDGSLRLVTQFRDGKFNDYDTKIEMSDFSVIEAPRAIRAFSVLSLAGLYSLVEGSGTKFIKGEANISTYGSRHRLEEVKATGNAVGVSMIGEFDRKAGTVDVSGNLVPVNQVNKLLGLVPLVGEVLTGIDKTGLFTTQFSIRGTSDDPDVKVNASSLAPGLLRDLFSPDWLGVESGRILGTELN